MRRRGWDYFTADCGHPPPETHCRVCGERLTLIQNVYGSRFFTQAVSVMRELHDVYQCEHSGEDWHDQVYALRDAFDRTPSAVLASQYNAEADDIVRTRKATKTKFER